MAPGLETPAVAALIRLMSNSGAAKGKVLVGLSGGVDSSVAAWLLQQQGYQVEALFMKNWEEDDTREYCSAAEDLRDAAAVCERLGIPLRTINFSAEYWDRVFSYFLHEYEAGRTPNPDVLCNKEIKFRAFLDHALEHGADCIATGHYVRTDRHRGRIRLLKGSDPDKDQSYFLYLLTQQQLANALFPLGEMTKSEVRRLAAELALPVAAKKDSTGICFIGERPFTRFLKRYIDERPGDICTLDGKVIGRHTGLTFFTIGQRQGLGIGGMQGECNEPWYVVRKDLAANRLIVAQGARHPALYRSQCEVEQLHWIGPPPAAPTVHCKAKTRYRQPDQACRVEIHGDRATVCFTEPQRALTPGQSLVLYDDDECLGGGIIL